MDVIEVIKEDQVLDCSGYALSHADCENNEGDEGIAVGSDVENDRHRCRLAAGY